MKRLITFLLFSILAISLYSQPVVNEGTGANTGTGATLREAIININDAFRNHMDSLATHNDSIANISTRSVKNRDSVSVFSTLTRGNKDSISIFRDSINSLNTDRLALKDSITALRASVGNVASTVKLENAYSPYAWPAKLFFEFSADLAETEPDSIKNNLTISYDDVDQTIDSIVFSTTLQNTAFAYMADYPYSGDEIIARYTKPVSNGFQDANGNEVASFTRTLTNNSSVTVDNVNADWDRAWVGPDNDSTIYMVSNYDLSSFISSAIDTSVHVTVENAGMDFDSVKVHLPDTLVVHLSDTIDWEESVYVSYSNTGALSSKTGLSIKTFTQVINNNVPADPDTDTDDEFVLHLELDNDVTDSRGTYTPVAVGTPVYNDYDPQQGTHSMLVTNGTGDWQVKVPSLDFGSDGFTVCSWIKDSTENAGQAEILFSNASAGGSTDYTGFSVWLDTWSETDRKIILYINDGSGTHHAINTNTNIVSENTWAHVAVSYDGSGVWNIYVNGDLVSNGIKSDFATNRDFYISGNVQESVYYWRGFIDDVRVYQRALTTSELDTIIGGYEPDPPIPTPTPDDTTGYFDPIWWTNFDGDEWIEGTVWANVANATKAGFERGSYTYTGDVFPGMRVWGCDGLGYWDLEEKYDQHWGFGHWLGYKFDTTVRIVDIGDGNKVWRARQDSGDFCLRATAAPGLEPWPDRGGYVGGGFQYSFEFPNTEHKEVYMHYKARWRPDRGGDTIFGKGGKMPGLQSSGYRYSHYQDMNTGNPKCNCVATTYTGFHAGMAFRDDSAFSTESEDPGEWWPMNKAEGLAFYYKDANPSTWRYTSGYDGWNKNRGYEGTTCYDPVNGRCWSSLIFNIRDTTDLGLEPDSTLGYVKIPKDGSWFDVTLRAWMGTSDNNDAFIEVFMDGKFAGRLDYKMFQTYYGEQFPDICHFYWFYGGDMPIHTTYRDEWIDFDALYIYVPGEDYPGKQNGDKHTWGDTIPYPDW